MYSVQLLKVTHLGSWSWSYCHNCSFQYFLLGFLWDEYTCFSFGLGSKSLHKHSVEHGQEFLYSASLEHKLYMILKQNKTIDNNTKS